MNINISILRFFQCLCIGTLLLTFALDSALAQPVSKNEVSSKTQPEKKKNEQGPKIIAPKEQKAEVDKILIFLQGFEQAVLTKDYNQVAKLISSNFVKVKPGQPLSKKDIKFIDSLFCGYIGLQFVRSCIKPMTIRTISLKELNFYAKDAWQLRYSISGYSIGPHIATIIIDLSLTKELVEGEGKVLRLMGPAG